MPASRFSSGKFSFGECARQSCNARPINSVSTPRIFRKSETIGMLPPSRIRATSLLKAFFNARCAASPKFAVRIGQIPRAMMTARHFQRHAGGQTFLKMFLHQIDNHVGVLVRDQTKRQLRHRVTWQDRFRARPLITAADPVDFSSRPRPNPFQSAEAVFAKERRRSRLLKHFGIRIERQFFPTVTFPIL